jgi:hypothetical protein
MTVEEESMRIESNEAQTIQGTYLNSSLPENEAAEKVPDSEAAELAKNAPAPLPSYAGTFIDTTA